MLSGYTLWASHSYFSRCSLKIGPLAGEMEDWIDENGEALRAASVVRVGVMDADGYSGSVWFNVK